MPASRPSQPAPAVQQSRAQIDGATTWQELARHLGTEVASARSVVNTARAARQAQPAGGAQPGARPAPGAGIGRAGARSRHGHAAPAACTNPRRARCPPVLNLADVARAALTALASWLTRHGVQPRRAAAADQVHRRHPALLADRRAQRGPAASAATSTASPWTRPRAWTAAPAHDRLVQAGRGAGIHLALHPLAPVAPAGTLAGRGLQLDMLDNRVRITITLPPVTDEQLATAMDSRDSPSSVSA